MQGVGKDCLRLWGRDTAEETEMGPMRADELKITDLRVAEIDGLPKHMILLKLYTNAGIIG